MQTHEQDLHARDYLPDGRGGTISELLVVILNGLQDKKEKSLREFYDKYEPEGSFKEKAECARRFNKCLRVIRVYLAAHSKEAS